MKLQQLLFPFLIAQSMILFSQNHEWVIGTGGIGDDYGASVTNDSIGNIYVAGNFWDTVDFDPGPAQLNFISNGASDFFVQKLDSDGDLIWANQIGGSGLDNVTSLTVDDSSNIYVTGYFRNTVDFDPSSSGVTNLTSHGGYDIFIQKLDALGNLIWAKQIGGTGDDRGEDIKVDHLGNIYTVGMFSGSCDFDPAMQSIVTKTSFGDFDMFIHKLDASGTLIWVKQIGGNGFDQLSSIDLDNSGNIYTTGHFSDTVDFNPDTNIVQTIISNGLTDVYILKMDNTGNLIWVNSFGGNDSDKSSCIALDDSANISLTGFFKDTVDFNTSPTAISNFISNGSYDVFIEKLDSSGNYLWASTFGGVEADYGSSIAVDDLGQVYCTGYFRDSADFNPYGTANNILTSNGQTDIFISKLNGQGDFISVQHIGGMEHDDGRSITVDNNRNIYTTGYFKSTVDFDPGNGIDTLTSINAPSGSSFSSSVGSPTWDLFIHKMNQCFPFVDTINATSCDTYLSPSGNHVWNMDGTYIDTIPDSIGCYSIVMVNLSINHSSDSTITVMECNEYISPSGKYTWTVGGTYMDTVQNTTGCDSIIMIQLSIYTIDTAVSQAGNTLTSNANGANYQWLRCDSGFSPVTGAINPFFTSFLNASYAVEISQNGCVDTSDCYETSMVSALNNQLGENFRLFPNPTIDKVIIDCNYNHDHLEITITDITGKIVSEIKSFKTNQVAIELVGPAGLYFIEINDQQGEKTVFKVLKM